MGINKIVDQALEKGANFQREKAKEELQPLIDEQVERSISLYLDRPEFYPERQAIAKTSESKNVFHQVTQLLQSHASNYESKN